MKYPEAALFLARFPKPFYLAFEHCMQIAMNWTQNAWPGEKVALIFNNQEPEQARMGDIHGAYAQSKAFGAALGSLTFGSRKEIPLLQTADLIAYEMLKNWTETIPQNLPDRPAIEIISAKKPMVQCKAYGLEALQRAIREYPE